MKLRYTPGLCLLFLLFCAALQAQTLKPYLQSATDHSIWINWRTASGMESTVLWGADPGSLSNTATGEVQEIGTSHWYHSVKIADLQPNTAYYYQVKTGAETSATYRFRTYQSAGSAGGHIRVLIVGDTQHPVTATNTFAAAKAKLIEKYGPNLEDQVQLILKQGDNVDAGVLNQYNTMHFDPLVPLSANIPTMTVAGNHEYYQDPTLSLYFPHVVYDDPELLYNGLAGQDAEHYYAFRVGSVLFCMLNSNEWWARQTQWLDTVVTTANADPTVKWIFATAHHPLRCENWISDGSAYIRDQIMPVFRMSEKSAMYTSGHSHMYARGSSRDSAVWEMISGGGGLIQNWNQNPEQDYPDVQRSFDVWTYQIMDLDLDAGTMDVETYSIGNFDYTLDNQLIDQFHRYFGKQAPVKPSLVPPPGPAVALPFTFTGSPYFSPENEPYNATEFEVSGPSGDFDNELELNVKRDFEDWFQITSPDYFSPIDQMAGVNIFALTVDSNQIYQGAHWLRVRYRDRNLEWSPWSDPIKFTATNGLMPLPLDPIAWYAFNGDAHDITEHGNDGTIPPAGVTLAQDPVRGNVALFDNTSSIPVRTGAGASIGLPVEQMTVTGWVKVATADTWGGFIGCLQDNGSYEKGWVLGTRSQRFSFALVSANTGAMTYIVDNEDFNLNQWYYVTATYTGETMKLYVNGALRTSTTDQNGDIVYAGLDSDWFGVGAYVDENENWVHHGGLDEVVLWARALSDDEVAELYEQANNLAPTVSISAPNDGANFIGPLDIAVSAAANDPDGSVGVVEFFNGTEKIYEDTDGAPFGFVWAAVPPGSYQIKAKATDNQGVASFSAPIGITVIANQEPQVSLISPVDQTEFAAPAFITLIASASDADGSLATLEFWSNGVKIGEDIDGEPFFFNWADVPAGTYTLTAQAIDNLGGLSVSAPVTVLVQPSVGVPEPGRVRAVSLAPNPTGGRVRILTDTDLYQAKLSLYNADHQLLAQQTLETAEADLSTFPAGIYFLEIKTERGERLQGAVVRQ